MSGLQFVGLFGSDGGGKQKTCYIEAVTASGLWTVPEVVTKIDLFLVPGGTGSGGATTQPIPIALRGRGGKPVTIKGVPVVPLSVHACVIGAGGAGGNILIVSTHGGDTSFDGYIAPGTETVDAAVSVFADEFEGLLVSGRGELNVAVIPLAGAGTGMSSGSGLYQMKPEPNTGSGGGVYGSNGNGTNGASGIIYIRYYK